MLLFAQFGAYSETAWLSHLSLTAVWQIARKGRYGLDSVIKANGS
jgi:hypothetical protein